MYTEVRQVGCVMNEEYERYDHVVGPEMELGTYKTCVIEYEISRGSCVRRAMLALEDHGADDRYLWDDKSLPSRRMMHQIGLTYDQRPLMKLEKNFNGLTSCLDGGSVVESRRSAA